MEFVTGASLLAFMIRLEKRQSRRHFGTALIIVVSAFLPLARLYLLPVGRKYETGRDSSCHVLSASKA